MSKQKQKLGFKNILDFLLKYWKVISGIITAIIFIIVQTFAFVTWKKDIENNIKIKISEAEARILVQIMQAEPELRYKDLLKRIERIESYIINKGE